MTTRNIVPRANNEGGIGTVAKKWASVWATLLNGLTLAAQAVGFTISGGTTPATLTVVGNATISGTNTGDTPAEGGNIVLNGGFTVNQIPWASGATLAPGAYGHDGWKAGAAGGNYSFTQLNSPTMITIATGKTLVQVIENKNVHESSYVLSWAGTAQARYAVNSATPAGAYAASPILITGQTPGTTMSIEFNEGTLGKVQQKAGSVATPFEYEDYGTTLRKCMRYYEKTFAIATVPGTANVATGAREIRIFSAAYLMLSRIEFMVQKLAAPTMVFYTYAGNVGSFSEWDGGGGFTDRAPTAQITEAGVKITSSGMTPNYIALIQFTASSRL